MEKKLKVCPSCQKENDPVFTACWKCGAVFEEGVKAAKKGSSPLPGIVVFAVAIVLVFVCMAFSEELRELFSGGKKSGGKDIPAAQKVAPSKVSGTQKNAAVSGRSQKKQTDLSGLEQVQPGPVPDYTGSYHLLVTSLPREPAQGGEGTGYAEGLIETYLQSHSGAVLLGKNPLRLQAQYPALEYKIGFKSSGDGRAGPLIHHAITAVIAGKAYTVSVDYSRDLGEKDAAVRKDLVDSFPKF